MSFESDFRNKARNLVSPASDRFNAADWNDAFEKSVGICKSDIDLKSSAFWINEIFSRLRSEIPTEVLSSVGKRNAFLLAVASSNLFFKELTGLSGRRIADALRAGALASDYIIKKSVHDTEDMPKLSADDSNENVIDAMESWFYDAAKFDEIGEESADIDTSCRLSFFKYNMQYALNDIWNCILWEGWSIQEDSESFVLTPFDRDLARLDRAWHARYYAILTGAPSLISQTWPRLNLDQKQKLANYSTVVRVDRAGRRLRPRIGRPSCRSLKVPNFLIDKSMIEDSYLNCLMDMPLLKNADITGWNLLKAWGVLADFVDCVTSDLAATQQLNHENLRRYSLEFSRSELLQILQRALHLSEKSVKIVLDFLTFVPGKSTKKHYGLWASPLVEIESGRRYSICTPVLYTSNAIRRAEIWFSQGGLLDESKGKSKGLIYERNVRQKFCEVIKSNEILAHSSGYPHSLKRGHIFGEEVDLIFKIGSTFVVCEIKCFVFPADSHAKYNLRENLQDAAKQAARKCKAADQNRDYIGKIFRLSEDEVKNAKFAPLVVVNHGFGTGLEFDGCIITDEMFISSFLDGQVYTSFAANSNGGGGVLQKVKYYENVKEAEASFFNAARNPPVLKRYFDRLYWDKSVFPTVKDKGFFLEILLLRDLDRDETIEPQLMLGRFQ
ncbi:hypothetical protein [Methylobacterium sp. GC_Met_2]|uniref:hypothetical protein n=1 Tax=Methylobacterium sp. GC_Met_2 TaxID=2937376 RepID=UPI00226BABD5|nr:hypothetical protein [Methylobacterium sp. GC_Met_2]